MMKHPFQLSIVHKGKHITGEIIPLHDSGIQGIPLSFTVVLEGKQYGMIRSSGDKWFSTEIGDDSLVNAIGQYIHSWYE